MHYAAIEIEPVLLQVQVLEPVSGRRGNRVKINELFFRLMMERSQSGYQSVDKRVGWWNVIN